MSTLVAHSAYLTNRSVKAMLRQPIFVFVTLIQPMVWLLLFGQLFKSVTQIPGFTGSGSYVEFLTPGVVAMTALFNAAWAGTVYIEDMNRGVNGQARLAAATVRSGSLRINCRPMRRASDRAPVSATAATATRCAQ